ncbi:activator-dependent family glycosyltransferase [Spirillospora sp. NPDC047279]|uniref:activator-dependent family glycosyltransferase n=1 Tax=Spirillospora sp. NPDC047279 TaxID=3155478 RepID=UPI0033CB4944
MRVLITSFAMDAHLNGSIPLAWALRTAGHEVRVASQPAATASITRAGLTAVPVGDDHRLDMTVRHAGPGMFATHADPDFLENRPERLSLDFMRVSDTILTSMFYGQLNNDSMVDDLVEYARFWRPDLVVWEHFTFAGAVAARASGAASARILSFPDTFMSVREEFVRRNALAPEQEREDMLAEWLTWTLARHGCDFDEEIVTGQYAIDQLSPSVSLTSGDHRIPMRYVPYNGPSPAVVPGWLYKEPERPRVCLTLGETIRKTEFPNAVEVGDVFEAVSDLDVELVALLSDDERDLVSGVPDNVRVEEYVPLHVLLPSCSAIVHHGGSGTWATAAVYGVPQIAMGWVWDAIYRARRLEELGAGLHIQSFTLTPELLREKLGRLLAEPSFAENSGRLRAEMEAAPTPNDAVAALEQRIMG